MLLRRNIIDERFFWLACDYDDATSFRDYVVNQNTGEKEPNLRTKSQVEPRKQFFACYDTVKYSLQGTTQGRYLTGGVPPVRFSM